jgi:hypothetical protein
MTSGSTQIRAWNIRNIYIIYIILPALLPERGGTGEAVGDGSALLVWMLHWDRCS